MAHWETAEITLWQIQARQQQNQIFATYGDRIWWSGYPQHNDSYLLRSLGVILYGPPPIHGAANIAYSGYTHEELNDIQKFMNIICNKFKGNFTYISVVFILTKLQNKSETEGVLRIWNDFEHLFIDLSGKIYKNWSAFLKNNKLPPRFICYPSEGRYRMGISLELCLEFGTTPSYKAPKYYRHTSSSCNFSFKTIFVIFFIILALISIYFAITAYLNILYAPAGVCVVGGAYTCFRNRYQVGVNCCCCCIDNCCDN